MGKRFATECNRMQPIPGLRRGFCHAVRAELVVITYTTFYFNCRRCYHALNMEEETRSRIDRYLRENAGIIRTADFQRAGIHNKYISTLIDEGRIVRVKPGLYIASDMQTAAGYFEVQIAIPTAVVCLGSALTFYDLSTYEPPSVHVAVPRGDRIRPPEFPPIKRFTFGELRYNLGIVQEKLEGRTFRIYDREKTICDVIRFRRTLGQNVVNEAIRTYLRGRDISVDRLLKYARQLNEEGPVQTHLRISA